MKIDVDVGLIGAGSLNIWTAYHLSNMGCRAAVFDCSDPFSGSTVKSAWLWSGLFVSNPTVAALTMAGRDLYRSFEAERGRSISRPIKVIYTIPADGWTERQAELEQIAGITPQKDFWTASAAEVRSLLPGIPARELVGAVIENGLRFDVPQLGRELTASIEERRGHVLARTIIDGKVRRQNGRWEIPTTEGIISASIVVNGTGANGDQVGEWFGVRPVGLIPTKRHRRIFSVPPGTWLPDPNLFVFFPDFYIATEACGTRLMASGADETPAHPLDTTPVPDETGRIRELVKNRLGIEIMPGDFVTAGHRTYVHDRKPVIGPDDRVPGFYHLLAPHGYGLQGGPAMALVLAHRILGKEVPEVLARYGFSFADVAVERLRTPETVTTG
jgi:glycine/D-amino acid oxidase-like deaminating enzyme